MEMEMENIRKFIILLHGSLNINDDCIIERDVNIILPMCCGNYNSAENNIILYNSKFKKVYTNLVSLPWNKTQIFDINGDQYSSHREGEDICDINIQIPTLFDPVPCLGVYELTDQSKYNLINYESVRFAPQPSIDKGFDICKHFIKTLNRFPRPHSTQDMYSFAKYYGVNSFANWRMYIANIIMIIVNDVYEILSKNLYEGKYTKIIKTQNQINLSIDLQKFMDDQPIDILLSRDIELNIDNIPFDDLHKNFINNIHDNVANIILSNVNNCLIVIEKIFQSKCHLINEENVNFTDIKYIKVESDKFVYINVNIKDYILSLKKFFNDEITSFDTNKHEQYLLTHMAKWFKLTRVILYGFLYSIKLSEVSDFEYNLYKNLEINTYAQFKLSSIVNEIKKLVPSKIQVVCESCQVNNSKSKECTVLKCYKKIYKHERSVDVDLEKKLPDMKNIYEFLEKLKQDKKHKDLFIKTLVKTDSKNIDEQDYMVLNFILNYYAVHRDDNTPNLYSCVLKILKMVGGGLAINSYDCLIINMVYILTKLGYSL